MSPAHTPALTSVRAFTGDCEKIALNSPHLSIDMDKLVTLSQSFNTVSSAPSWANYISTEASTGYPVDVTRVFFEMAMICAQQGGFITPDENGVPQKWNINGSGAAAMLQKMTEIRDAKALPGIDITDTAQLRAALAPHLAGVPFAEARQQMFAEFASPQTYAALDALVKGAHDRSTNTYNFDFDFINKAADLFPQSFASDPFRKKIILAVLMTASFAHAKAANDELRDMSPAVITTNAPVAADYVLPQVLEGLGVLKLSDRLRDQLLGKAGFDENDSVVRDLRAATIHICDLLSAMSGKSPQDIDAHLWLAGRDPAVKPTLKPAINVYTTWF